MSTNAAPQRHCLVCFSQRDAAFKDTEAGDIVKRQLDVIYLVNKLLEIPLELSVRYLIEYGNPEAWVVLCSECDLLVNEGRVIFDQIQGLLKKHKKIKKNVIMKMKIKPEPDQEFGSDQAALEIRRFLEILGNLDCDDETFYCHASKDTNKDKTILKKSKRSSRKTKLKLKNTKAQKPRTNLSTTISPKKEVKVNDIEGELSFLLNSSKDDDWLLNSDIDEALGATSPVQDFSSEYNSKDDIGSEDSEDKDFELRKSRKRKSKPETKKSKNKKPPTKQKKYPNLTLKQVIDLRNKFLAEIPHNLKDLDVISKRKWRWKKDSHTMRRLCRMHKVTEFPCMNSNCSMKFLNYDDWFKHNELFSRHSTCEKSEQEEIILNQPASFGKIHCEECGKGVGNTFVLEDHYRTAHYPKEILNCRGCSIKFGKCIEYQKHYHDSVKADPTSNCSILGLRCPNSDCRLIARNNQEALDLHIKLRHTNPPPNPFVCAQCNLTFHSKRGLTKHMGKKHDKNLEYKFKCDYENCTSAFQHQAYLETHKTSVHLSKLEGAPRFHCNVCQKEFRLKNRLLRHEKLHYSESPYLCTHCGKTFKLKNYLTIHMWSHDPEKKKKFTTYRDNAIKAKSKKNATFEQETGDDQFQY